MTRIKFTLLSVMLLLTVLVSPARGETRKIRVGIPAVGTSNLAFATSQQKGYYREEGLQVELILLSPQMATQAVISRDLDFN